MSPVLVLLVMVCLPVSVFLDEAAMWFARNSLDSYAGEEERRTARKFARSASHAHLLSRFLVSLAFAVLIFSATRTPTLSGVMISLTVALVWAFFTAALSGVHWRSPLSLIGRAMIRPLGFLGAIAGWIFSVWGRMAGEESGENEDAAREQVQMLGQEGDWLLEKAETTDQGKMLATLREFGESLVEDVMVQRESMVAIPASAEIPEILSVVQNEGHSRYPVYSESQDTVVGVLHVFDLLSANPGVDAGSLARPALFTSATKSVGTLLRELQVTYNQMAVVVDEYGGVAGLVTVEDLLEELVGEIEDEHDEEETPLKELEPGVYWIQGTMRVDEINEALALEVEEGEYDTVAGLFLDRLERVPRVGERLRENGVWLEVLTAEPNRVHAVKLVVDP